MYVQLLFLVLCAAVATAEDAVQYKHGQDFQDPSCPGAVPDTAVPNAAPPQNEAAIATQIPPQPTAVPETIAVPPSEFPNPALLESVGKCFNALPKRAGRMVGPLDMNIAPPESANAPFVVLEKFLDDKDISDLKFLAACIKEFAPSHIEDRHFGAGAYSGNLVTFLSGFAQKLMPEFMEHVTLVASLAADAANWRPHPFELRVRCVEVLEYFPGGNLSWHTDGESVYTVTAMLGDPSEFVGGDFLIQHKQSGEGLTTRIRPGRGNGLMFDSEAVHCVEPIDEGRRLVLCVEFWSFEEARELRPMPTMYKPIVQTILPLNEEYRKRGLRK